MSDFLAKHGMTPASPSIVRQWLASLGVLVAGGQTAADAALKVETVASMLDDFPDECFSRESLKAAGIKFTWFPSLAEAHAFLSARRAALIRSRLPAAKVIDLIEYSEAHKASMREGVAKLAADRKKR